MSATPYRPDDDSAFGPPDVKVSYQEAVEESSVKPLRLHSYVYRVDLYNPETAQIYTYTTEQLIDEVGSDAPEAIDKFVLDRQMRWSPKYISPLVDIPIARMNRERLRTGYPLQTLVGAMSCSHAELVCKQLRAMFPELRIDWVGTGPQGRNDKDNDSIIRKFCPPKRKGVRRPQDIQLDVLVHVGMAGEGLDSVYVSEVVHLNRASINNSNHQENGRAARYLPDVTGYINVDSSSPYAPYIGASVMALMDDPTASPDPDEEDIERNKRDDADWMDLPEEPTIRIWDMECIRVDEGEVQRMAVAMGMAAHLSVSEVLAIFNDPSHVDHEKYRNLAEHMYRSMRTEEAESFNLDSQIKQWQEKVREALRHLTGGIIKLMKAADARVEQSFAGDITKRINQQKARELGPIEPDIDQLKRHYHWLRDLQAQIKREGMPIWLQ
jgi:hypothetical protein